MSNQYDGLVKRYLEYLRDVSRKIVSRGGFDNVLPKENRLRQNYYFNLEGVEFLEDLLNGKEVSVTIFNNKNFYNYLKSVINIISSQHSDKRLFAGFGIFYGMLENRVYFAPLLTSVCNIFYENGYYQITIDLGLDNIQFNYDFLARVSNFRIEDEEMEDSLSTQEIELLFEVIDALQLKFENEKIDKETLNTLVNEIIEHIPALNFIKTDIEYFTHKFENPNFAYEKRYEIINQERLFFEPHFFLFVREVPGVLTTFQSLSQLLEEDLQKNELLLTLMENKLLNTTKTFPKPEQISETEIEKVLFYMPIELSNSQREAIKKVWLEPILYIQGPPGTGKSYTIQAIILTALMLNKKVLFVSQKLPAIEVVKKSIDEFLGENPILFPTRDHQKYKNETIDYLNRIVDKFNSYIELAKLNELESKINNHKAKVKNLIKQIEMLSEAILRNLDYVNKYYYSTNKVVEFREKIIREIKRLQLNFELNLRFYNFLPLKNEHPSSKFNNVIELLLDILSNTRKNVIEKFIFLKAIGYFANIFQVPQKLISKSLITLNDLYYLNYYGNLSANYSDHIYGEQLNNSREKFFNLNIELRNISKELIPLIHNYNIYRKILSNKEILKSIKNYYLSLKRVSKKYIQQHWQEVDFEALLDVFPIWCATLNEVSNVLPMKPNLFDIIVIDEASQVNIAEIIPVFFRGKRFCVVGDDKQLHLNSTGLSFALSKAFDIISWNKNKLKEQISISEAKTRKLLVSEASILNFIMFEYESHSIPKVFLNEHYRSLPRLINFNNREFYNNSLIIMSENGLTKSLDCYKVIKVDGKREPGRKFVQAEIDKAIELLEKLMLNDNWKNLDELQQLRNLNSFMFSMPYGRPSIGVLSFLREQINKFYDTLNNSSKLYKDILDQYDFMIGTPEEFQGNERDIMIITFGLDSESGWGKQHYENPNRFNVATSRARYFTYIVYAGIPRNAELIRKYFKYIGIQYEDSVKIPTDKWIFDKSLCESEFELIVAEYLEKYISRRPNIKLFNQVKAFGGVFRLDFVLFNEEKNISLAVEVDGKHHFKGDTSIYTDEHLERITILKRAGWKVINLKYFDWYFNGWLNDESIDRFKNYIQELYQNFDALLEVHV